MILVTSDEKKERTFPVASRLKLLNVANNLPFSARKNQENDRQPIIKF